MYKIYIFFITFILLTPSYIYAQPICSWVQRLLNETESSAEDLFRKKLQGDEFTVIGTIMDVKIGKDSLLEFYISSCNNQMLTTFLCRNTKLNSNFKIRERIKFIGKCTNMKKGALKSTGQRFVWFFFENVDVWPNN
jgi:hypothetical protein